jgi:hypothetical protein
MEVSAIELKGDVLKWYKDRDAGVGKKKVIRPVIIRYVYVVIEESVSTEDV